MIWALKDTAAGQSSLGTLTWLRRLRSLRNSKMQAQSLKQISSSEQTDIGIVVTALSLENFEDFSPEDKESALCIYEKIMNSRAQQEYFRHMVELVKELSEFDGKLKSDILEENIKRLDLLYRRDRNN